MTRPPIVHRKLAPCLVAGAAAVACSGAIAIALALLESSLLGADAAYAPVVPLACVLSVVLVSRAARRSDGGSAVRAATWALVAWAPYLFCAAAYDLSNPMVHAHWRCGTGDVGLIFLALLSLPVVFSSSILVALAVDRFRLTRGTRLFAAVAVGAAAIVLVFSLRRSHKLERDAYLASLPAVAEFAKDDDRFDGPSFFVEERLALQPGKESEGTARVGPCMIFARASGQDPAEVAPVCEGTRVLRDQAHDLWIFRAPQKAPSSSYAVDGRSGRVSPVDIDVKRVASSLRPPAAWTASLAVGTALALALVGVALGIRRRADAWRTARPGLHGGGGWVTFEDGTPPAHFATAATFPGGPVLVLESSRTVSHYREHGRPAEGARLAAGSFEDLAQAAAARATDLYAVASLVALLTLAPMLAAGLYGLLG